jgi:uncharacterized coiled-coil protein SlyX
MAKQECPYVTCANELRPCPLCGGEAVIDSFGNVVEDERFGVIKAVMNVRCSVCNLSMTCHRDGSDWNRRFDIEKIADAFNSISKDLIMSEIQKDTIRYLIALIIKLDDCEKMKNKMRKLLEDLNNHNSQTNRNQQERCEK